MKMMINEYPLLSQTLENIAIFKDLVSRTDYNIEMLPKSKSLYAIMVKWQAIRANEAVHVKPAIEKYLSYVDPGSNKRMFINSDFDLSVLVPLAKKINAIVLEAIDVEKKLAASVYQLALPKNKNFDMGGLFDWFTSSDNLADDGKDIERGEKALRFYYDAASLFPSFTWKSWDEFKSYINSKNAYFFEGLGMAWRTNQDFLTEGTVIDVMHKLADGGQGQMPVNWTTFFNALGQAASDPSWWSAVIYVSRETAIETFNEGVSMASEITGGIRDTITMTKYLPYIVLGAGALFIGVYAYGQSKSLKTAK